MTTVTVSNTGIVVNDEAGDPDSMGAVTEEEDTVNPIEMMVEDNCQDEDSI